MSEPACHCPQRCCAEVNRLRDRVAELEAALSSTEQFPDQAFQPLRLHPLAIRMLKLLLKREFVSRDAAYAAFYNHRNEDDRPSLQIISVSVCHVRKALTPLGVKIVTTWGVGWRMPPAEKDKLKKLLGDGVSTRKDAA